MMAYDGNKYPFFQKLRTVASTVSNDVKAIERKLQTSKFELPENHSMFKLINHCDEVKKYKSDSEALLQQIHEKNQKYVCYHQDIEALADEVERSIAKVEESLVGYGYKKWKPEYLLQDDCDQLPPSASCVSPSKETVLKTTLTVEREEEESALQKTPLLADYGLTAKIPKHLPSALKDRQGSILKSAKKQVHFESPERQSDSKAKENRAPCSLQKTPLLEDYGLPSRKRNPQIPIDTVQEKDILGIKKHLHFRSPLRLLSENGAQNNETCPLVLAEVDSTEVFKELVGSIPLGMKNPVSADDSKEKTQVGVFTPEEPVLSSTQRFRFTGSKNKTVTPEEPDIQPVRILETLKKEQSETPEEPVVTPMARSFKGISGTPEEPVTRPLKYTYKNMEPHMPKPPEIETTTALGEWLRSQRKK